MMQRERRSSGRKTLNPLPYINLPDNNGGIVLDVSEQGLRFRAIAPVEQSGPILFWFTAHSNLIAGVAELAWTDETKKYGGLRFTQLPYNACEQIRKWPYEAAFRPGFGEDLTLHIPAPDSGLAGLGTEARDARRTLISADALNADRRETETFEAILREGQLLMQAEPWHETQPFSWGIYLKQHWRPISRSACALILGIIIPAVFYAHHRQAGKWLVWLGTKLSGQVGTVSAAAVVSPQPLPIEVPILPAPMRMAGPIQPLPPPQAMVATVQTPKQIAPVAALAPAPAKERTTDADAPKPTARGTELIVQVAALEQEDDARKLAESLRQQNFKASVSTLPIDSLYRVLLGPCPDAASARTLVAKLKKAGFKAFIRREVVSESQGI